MPFLLTIFAILLTLFVVTLAVAAIYALILRFRYRVDPPADQIYAVTTPDNWKLRLFRHRPVSPGAEPVLLVPGVTANHYEFEFPRGASLADTLVDAGYDCWILDPRGRRSSTPPADNNRSPVTVDDHLIHDIPAAVDFVRAATRYENVHYIGHSLGGMLLYAYDAAYGRDNIASAVTLGAPLGFEHVPYRSPKGLIAVASVARPVVEFMGRCLAPLAHLLKLKSRILPLNWSNLHPGVRGRETYHILEVPPSRIIQDLDEMAREKFWKMHNGEVDVVEGLRDLEIPLFAIFGAQDPFTPRSAYEPFFEQLDQPDKRMLVLSTQNGHSADYNHIDIVLGRNSRTEVFEPIVEWLREHPNTRRLSRMKSASATESEAVTTASPETEMEAQVSHSRGEAGIRPKAKLVIDIPEPVELPEDANIPVLPGASNDELARLARELQEDAAPRIPIKKFPAKRATPIRKAAAKPPAKKAPAVSAKKVPVAKKKLAAKRKPKE
jgi:pimeloyl-ACP methyl ester carboxylesterase